MTIPIFGPTIIKTSSLPKDADFGGLRILRAQTDEAVQANWRAQAYEFQLPAAPYTMLRAVVSRKGFLGVPTRSRIVATVHPTLQMFTEIVKYDPSNPPPNDYQAAGMKQMHERTQSDFKGQKQQNKEDFRDYLLEGLDGARTVYLPTVSGWQSTNVFDQTVFVALDEADPASLYGMLYLPKAPIMQSDGQTQTAALFAVAATKEAVDRGALGKMRVTLEIELNMNEQQAGQSFADRNGRGSKKNKNLVISMDTSSPLSELRVHAVAGTVFQSRLANGRDSSTSEKATESIMDLSTMEQMLLGVIGRNRQKPEHIKHFHVKHFQPYATEFMQLLDQEFGRYWVARPKAGEEPFRRLYVHGWPFVLKALARAYHQSRIDVLGPMQAAMKAQDPNKTQEQAFVDAWEQEKAAWSEQPTVTFEELKNRIRAVRWERYREHWSRLVGGKMDKKGGPRKVQLKGVGVVGLAQAQNTETAIMAVFNTFMSPNWVDLTSTNNA